MVNSVKAVQLQHYGGSDALSLVDVDIPTPGDGEVLVRIESAGVNFIDIYMREGHYQQSSTYGSALPFTLGMEAIGTVVDANGDSRLQVGDRVAYCLSRGSYAEYAVVPAWKLVVVPPDIDSNTGVALMLQGCTAHYLTHSLFPLSAGDWCLVHAGAGGVGQLLIQLAKKRGAQVITTVGTSEKSEIVKHLGADHAVLYREVDFFEAVQSVTEGQGVDVVYDAVGKQTIASSIRCLKRRGTCVNYGGSSGLVETVSPLALAEAGSVFFTRPHLAHYMADQVEIQSRCVDLFEAVGSGALSVTVDREFKLSAFAKAHARLESRGTLGKLLLRIG